MSPTTSLFKICLVAALLFAVSSTAFAVENKMVKPSKQVQFSAQELIASTNKSLEKHLNIKLNWKDKLALNIVRKKLRKRIKKNPELASAPALSLDASQKDRGAVLSFAFGLGSFVVGFFLSGIVGAAIGVVGLIIGLRSLSRIKKNPSTEGKGLAKAGVIISAAMIVLGLLAAFVNI